MSILSRFSRDRKVRGRDMNLILDAIDSLRPMDAVDGLRSAAASTDVVAAPGNVVTSIRAGANITADKTTGDVVLNAAGFTPYLFRAYCNPGGYQNVYRSYVLFDTVDVDPNGEFTAPGFFTAGATGTYLVNYQVEFSLVVGSPFIDESQVGLWLQGESGPDPTVTNIYPDWSPALPLTWTGKGLVRGDQTAFERRVHRSTVVSLNAGDLYRVQGPYRVSGTFYSYWSNNYGVTNTLTPNPIHTWIEIIRIG